MKKKTLKLNDLKVKSFITNMNGEDSQTVKGGTGFLSRELVCPIGTNDDTLDFTCNEDGDESQVCTHNCSITPDNCPTFYC